MDTRESLDDLKERLRDLGDRFSRCGESLLALLQALMDVKKLLPRVGRNPTDEVLSLLSPIYSAIKRLHISFHRSPEVNEHVAYCLWQFSSIAPKDTLAQLFVQEEQLADDQDIAVVMSNIAIDDSEDLRGKSPTEIIKDMASRVEEIVAAELVAQHASSNTSIIEARRTKNELEDIRQQLIQALRKNPLNDSSVGVKVMGRIDPLPFKNVLGASDSEVETIVDYYQDKIADPNWDPMKRVIEGESFQEVIDEENEDLKELIQVYGVHAYDVVITALKEINKYNPSGRYCVCELWNYEEERKATIKEVLENLLEEERLECDGEEANILRT